MSKSFLFRLRRRCGIVAPLAALLMALFAALAALTMDLALAQLAKSEAQRAADAAALAGAAALIETPDDPARAQAAAAAIASENTIRGKPVLVGASDVVVHNGADTTFTVRAVRDGAHGGAMPTLFAKIFGIDSLTASAQASSMPYPSGSVTCLKPFIVPDAWDDANRNGKYDTGEAYSGSTTGYGSNFRSDYSHDIGRPIVLYPGSTGTASSSWYFLLRIAGNSGGSDLRRDIGSLNCNKSVMSVGQTYIMEPGKNTGPIRQGLEDLIAQDPGAYWDQATRSVKNSRWGEGWYASPRVARIALFPPSYSVLNGAQPVLLSGFATVFVENSGSGGSVTGRFLPVVGTSDGTDCKKVGNCSPFVKYPRLLQ